MNLCIVHDGYSPDHLRADRGRVDCARAGFSNERPVFAICHGPQLMTAHVVRGRRMTAWQTIQDDLSQVGADVVDDKVVVDRRLVTSRRPDDVPAFSREAVRMLQTASATRWLTSTVRAVTPVPPPAPGDPPAVPGTKPPELPTEPDPVPEPTIPAPGPPIPEPLPI